MEAITKGIVLAETDVRFIAETHEYKKGWKTLEGVTGGLIPFAYPDVYATPDCYSEEEWQRVLANAAKEGTRVHEDIQSYCEYDTMPETPEGNSWLKAEKEHDIRWIASEYLVTDERRFASKVDIVAMVNGELSIIDIKRTSELHYDTVTLQTSLYKMWFERMNKGLKVEHLYVFWARGENWKLVELSVIRPIELRRLIRAYKEKAKGYVFNPIPAWCTKSLCNKLDILLKRKQEIDLQVESLKAAITMFMEKHHDNAFEGHGYKFRYVPETKSRVFDKKAFESKHPELVEEFTKESTKAGYIKLTKIKG